MYMYIYIYIYVYLKLNCNTRDYTKREGKYRDGTRRGVNRFEYSTYVYTSSACVVHRHLPEELNKAHKALTAQSTASARDFGSIRGTSRHRLVSFGRSGSELLVSSKPTTSTPFDNFSALSVRTNSAAGLSLARVSALLNSSILRSAGGARSSM